MPAFNPLSLKLQELQQRQQIASMLQQQGMAPLQSQVSGTGSYPIVVRTSPLEGIAKVANAAAGGYMQRQNNKQYSDIADQMMAAQNKSLMDLAGGGPQGSSGAPPSSGTPSTAGVPPAPSMPPPLITNPGYSLPPTIPAPAAAPPIDNSFARKLVGYQNAADYGVDPEVIKIAAANDAPTNEQRNIAAIYGANSPQGRAALERVVNPAVATPANSSLARFNPQTGQYETAYAPPDITKGIQPVITNGQITGVQKLPGSEEVNAGQTAATTAATQANTPHWVEDPIHPGQVREVYARPPGYSGGGINDLGSIGRGTMPSNAPTAATLEGMKTGAKTGTDYAADLSAKAADAVEGKRTLGEMQNLLQGFQPGKLTPLVGPLGSAAVAMGVDPATVQKLTNINPGDAEAFQKGTAALAGEAAKQVTNRVTQTEFKVFLANNPNWAMTSDGIKRVIDFMGKGFDQKIDQQQQFADWSKTSTPDRWGIDFPAEYNTRQVAAIKAGALNSTPAALSTVKTAKDLAAASGPVAAVHSRADFDKLPPGTLFVGPDGIRYQKPK